MSGLLLAWAVLASGFTLVALFRLRGTKPEQVPARWPEVLLLRPVDAPTPLELANLSAELHYDAAVEHVVLSPYRPRLGPGVSWLYSDPLAANRKAAHLSLARASLRTAGRVVVSADADVVVTGALLRALVAPILDGAALSVAPPSPSGARTLAGEAVRGLLGHGHHSFLAMSKLQAGAPAVCGKALAFSAEAFALLEQCERHIGEDLELSRLLHARGARSHVTFVTAVTGIDPDLRWRAAVSRFSRWMVVLKAHRPALFPSVPLLFAPTPLILVLAVATASPWPAVLLIASRVALALRLGSLTASREGAAWTWMLGELLLLQAWLTALVVREVRWRGRTLRIRAGGEIRFG